MQTLFNLFLLNILMILGILTADFKRILSKKAVYSQH